MLHTQRIIIIDASYTGEKPGDVIVRTIESVLANKSQCIESHGHSLLDELKISQRRIEGLFIGIRPHKIDCFMGLSSTLKKRFSSILNRVNSIISEYLRLT